MEERPLDPDDETYPLAVAARIVRRSVPDVLRLCREGRLDLIRAGPHDAIRITRRSVLRLQGPTAR